MLGAAGVIAMETKAAAGTVSVTGLDVMEPETAVIVVLPTARAVARPLEPVALLIDATEVDEETHVAAVVRFWVELSV